MRKRRETGPEETWAHRTFDTRQTDPETETPPSPRRRAQIDLFTIDQGLRMFPCPPRHHLPLIYWISTDFVRKKLPSTVPDSVALWCNKWSMNGRFSLLRALPCNWLIKTKKKIGCSINRRTARDVRFPSRMTCQRLVSSSHSLTAQLCATQSATWLPVPPLSPLPPFHSLFKEGTRPVGGSIRK